MKTLVAVDDTRPAAAALEWACEFLRGESVDSTAEVFTVWQPVEALGIDGFGLVLDSDYPARSEELLARLLDEVGSPDRVQGYIGSGRPDESILLAAEECNLIVMGTRGGGPARQALLGSLSQSIVGAANCPVVIVPETLPDPGGISVVAWDDSAGCHSALDWALEHRDPAKVTVLHVPEPQVGASGHDEAVDRVRAEVASYLGTSSDELMIEVIDGDVVEVITSSLHSASEVIVGQRASFGPEGSIWGSITSHVISRSTRPVIVVPPPVVST